MRALAPCGSDAAQSGRACVQPARSDHRRVRRRAVCCRSRSDKRARRQHPARLFCPLAARGAQGDAPVFAVSAAVCPVILFDLLLLYQHPSAPLLDRGLLAASAVAFLGVYLGSLQMFAYFDDSIRRTWLNGAKLFIARLPHMLLAMALLLLPFVLLLLSPDTFFRLFIVFLLLGVSGPVFALQLMLRAVMKNHTPLPPAGESDRPGRRPPSGPHVYGPLSAPRGSAPRKM